MKTLFISTYTNLVSIGLLEDGKNIVFKEEISNLSHSKHLMPHLIKTLRESNVLISEIDEIIVVNGPGSFTGVRLGVIVAKTLAYTLNKNIKTITSIEALGISDVTLSKKIISVKDSKGYYYGVFEDNNLVDEIKYVDISTFDKLGDLKIEHTAIDIEKVYLYLKDKPSLNPHSVNPIYIKEIEALK